MKKNIVLPALTFIACLCLSSCHVGNHSTDSEQANPSDTARFANPGISPRADNKVDERCKTAVSKLIWKDVDRDEATKACQLFHAFLIEQYHEYKKSKFYTHPVAPYYFMDASVEREYGPVCVIHAQEGVIPKNSAEAVQSFVKHIDILNTTSDAKSLAYMLYAFHAGETEDLVTDHRDAGAQGLEMNPPAFLKNEDGSATLTYELKKLGRSRAVRQCVVTIGKDYTIALDCKQKQ